MLIELNNGNVAALKNPNFRTYAGIYTRIHDDFMAQVRGLGASVDDIDYSEQARERIERLGQSGAIVRNDAKSVFLHRVAGLPVRGGADVVGADDPHGRARQRKHDGNWVWSGVRVAPGPRIFGRGRVGYLCLSRRAESGTGKCDGCVSVYGVCARARR